MDKVYYEYYKSNPQGLLRYLNDDISNEDVEKIFSLQNLTLDIKNDYSHVALKGISKKEESIIKDVFYKYIECDTPYFKYRHIDKFLKYTKIIDYNFYMIKIYDNLNLIDLYINKIGEFDSERNAGVLLFYYILKKSKEDVLELINKLVKSKLYNNVKRNRKDKISFEILIHSLSVNNMSYYNGFIKNLFEFLNDDMFDSFKTGQQAKILKKLSGYYNNDEYKNLYNKISLKVTPNQFLELKARFEKDDIEKYCSVIENHRNLNYYILQGLNKTTSYILVQYIRVMSENGLINNQNSTEILKSLLTYKEFLSYEKMYKKNIYEMYDILLKTNPNLNELENHFNQKIYSIWIGSIYEKNHSFFQSETKKRNMIKNGLDELKFMKRRDLINRIKNKLVLDE